MLIKHQVVILYLRLWSAQYSYVVKMDDLTQAQVESLQKISTERLRSRLIKIGYDEDLIFATERSDLLTMLAEYMIKPEVTDLSLDESADTSLTSVRRNYTLGNRN